MAAALAATSTPGSGGFWDSFGSSLSSIGMFYQGVWSSAWGDTTAARKHYADAYANGPLGQSTGAYHTGVQVSLGTGVAAMTAVVGMAAAGTSGPVLWGGTTTVGGGLTAGTVVNANRLAHIFGNPGHNLSGYLGTFGGSQTAAFSAMETATVSTLTRLGLTAGTFQEVVTVAGFQITVRGSIVGGVVKIGTAFIP